MPLLQPDHRGCLRHHVEFGSNYLDNTLPNYGRTHVRVNRYRYAHLVSLHQRVAQHHVFMSLHQI